MYGPFRMDTTTTGLIVSQTITLLLLIISEILPMTDSQYNGILQIVVGILRQTVVVRGPSVATQTVPPPSIVEVKKEDVIS